MHVKPLQSCPTLCDPTDRSPPDPSVRRIPQARLLEWVAMPSSRGSSRPRDQTHVSCISHIGRWVLYHSSHCWYSKGQLWRSDIQERHQCSCWFPLTYTIPWRWLMSRALTPRVFPNAYSGCLIKAVGGNHYCYHQCKCMILSKSLLCETVHFSFYSFYYNFLNSELPPLNSTETCIVPYVKQMNSASLMHEAGRSKPGLWGNPEGWGGEGGGSGFQVRGTQVHPWVIHVNVWQKKKNHHNTAKKLSSN